MRASKIIKLLIKNGYDKTVIYLTKVELQHTFESMNTSRLSNKKGVL